MKLIYEKIITKKEYTETIISKWIKPKGYDLSMTSISIECLRINVQLVFGEYSEFKKFIKDKHSFDIIHNDCTAMVVTLNHEDLHWNYILIRENEWKSEHYGTICHELHHLTHFALTDKGITYGETGEELYAYLQGYLMELVVKAFIELKKAKKK